MTAGPLGRVGGAAARHPVIALIVWTVLVGVAVATALAGVSGQTLFQRLTSAAPTVAGESSAGDDLTSGNGQATQTVTLLVHGVAVSDPAMTAAVALLAATLKSRPNTTFVDPLLAPTNPAFASLRSADATGVLLPATVTGVSGADPDPATVDAVVADLRATAATLRTQFPAATVEVGSSALLVSSIVKISESDLQRGETIALPIALVVMLVVFGGFVAAGIPLIGAIAAIVGAFGALFGITHLMDIDTTVINVVTAVGLGLSIDYGLLIVSRFREELRTRELGATAISGLRRDASPDERLARRIAAIVATADSAGRTVVFSGITFAIASLGLLVFDPRMVKAIGLGALSVTIIAIASALTLIPALLALTGDKLLRPGALTRLPVVGPAILRFGDVAPAEGFFSRLTRRVQRHPAIITIGVAALLIGVGSPLATLHLANTSIDALPPSSTQYAFTTTLNEQFPDAASPRVALVTRSEADATSWSTTVAGLAHVTSVGTPVKAGDGWRTAVRVESGSGIDVVHEIRDHRPTFDTWVTGIDARTVDFSDSLLRSAPWAVLVLALGTIVLLFLMTGSLVVPLKALLASALSLGASIGVLVWGFEFGNFAGLFGFDPSHVHGVDVLVLLLTIVFGFGLAMDYEMFILSRIKEQADAGTGPREAIALGLQRSGRIITSAALIIIVVFTGFATGDLMVIKQLGVGLAVAVLVDATLVRCLLVPAFMTWQQRIMWWAPRWMKQLHARFGFSD